MTDQLHCCHEMNTNNFGKNIATKILIFITGFHIILTKEWMINFNVKNK